MEINRMSSTNKEYVPVADFYAGRSVFLTGVSGFLGKVVLEKLLYSCEDIDKIYVLIRGKKDMSAEERFTNMKKLPIFTRLKDKRPGDLDKIVPVVGDLSVPNLGIRDEDQRSFVDKVSVVIHSAAALKYDDPLDEAMNINVEGTRRVLDLCRRMPKLGSFVHVSTAFSNTDRKVIEEVVYPAPAKLSDVYASIKKYGSHDKKATKKILNGKLNTYIFTKALAENLVADNNNRIPTTIVRPSAVGAAIQEPVPGWVDNWFAATGIVHIIGNGNIRAVYGKHSNVLDLIPVDYVANLIVVAAARNEESKNMPVYNCCTSSCNPLSYEKFFHTVKKFMVEKKYYDSYPAYFFTENKLVLNLATFFLQKLPANMFDVYMKIKGKESNFSRYQSKMIKIRDQQEKFTSKSWEMKADRTRSLYSSLSSADQREFAFDPIVVNWNKYLPLYCQGIRRYLLRK